MYNSTNIALRNVRSQLLIRKISEYNTPTFTFNYQDKSRSVHLQNMQSQITK